MHHGLATQSYGYLLRKETDAAAKEDAAVAASPSSFEAWGQALQEGAWGEQGEMVRGCGSSFCMAVFRTWTRREVVMSPRRSVRVLLH